MGSIYYRCPKCHGREVRYDYGLRTSICPVCRIPSKNFERYVTEYVVERILGKQTNEEKNQCSYTTQRIRLGNLDRIQTTISCACSSVSPKTFDLLGEMAKRISLGSFSRNDIEIWMTTYPSMDSYLETDRTIMPLTRPCIGSVSVHCQRPDGKQAHFGIADFWDTNEQHHNPEYLWKDFEEKDGYDKGVKGHRIFNIKEDVILESRFAEENVKIVFRGQKPNENVKPRLRRVR